MHSALSVTVYHTICFDLNCIATLGTMMLDLSLCSTFTLSESTFIRFPFWRVPSACIISKRHLSRGSKRGFCESQEIDTTKQQVYPVECSFGDGCTKSTKKSCAK